MNIGKNPYVIDTGIWIDLHKYYPQDLFPDIWDELNQLFTEGRLWSPAEVRRELMQGWDDLAKRVDQEFPGIFVPDDNIFLQMVANVRLACPTLQNPQSTNNIADLHIVAFASIHEGIVICNELAAKPSSTRMKVPDACKLFSIPCLIFTTEFIRERRKERGS